MQKFQSAQIPLDSTDCKHFLHTYSKVGTVFSKERHKLVGAFQIQIILSYSDFKETV